MPRGDVMIGAHIVPAVEAGMRGSFWLWLIIIVPPLVVGGYYTWRRYRHWFR